MVAELTGMNDASEMTRQASEADERTTCLQLQAISKKEYNVSKSEYVISPVVSQLVSSLCLIRTPR